MVEKVKALCDAIDTLNSLPGCENNDKTTDELVALLLAECKQMVEKPVKQASPPVDERVYTAGNDIEPGDPLLIVGDKVYSTVARPAKPVANEGFHTLVPPHVYSSQDIARAALLREMGEINGDIPSGQKIYMEKAAEDIFPERAPSPPTTYQKNHPDLGLPRLP